MNMIRGDGFDVEIIRSKRRKTMALAVGNGTVKVRMPARLALHHAERFIEQKQHWIKAKLAQNPPIEDRLYRDGETLPFLGNLLTLRISPGNGKNQVRREDDNLFITSRQKLPSQSALKKQVTDWYKQQAGDYLSRRTNELAISSGLRPASVEVKTYKARWGSCTISGKVQLNWKLVMAPTAIIDYVIIHELCHLKQHNHSPAFWQLVGQFDSNFTRHRAWLKGNGQQLQL